MPGSLIRLNCRSLGISNETRLVWYNNDKLVDDSYIVSDVYVINEYELSAPQSGVSNLECRLLYPPTRLEQGAKASVTVQGLTTLSFLLL